MPCMDSSQRLDEAQTNLLIRQELIPSLFKQAYVETQKKGNYDLLAYKQPTYLRHQKDMVLQEKIAHCCILLLPSVLQLTEGSISNPTKSSCTLKHLDKTRISHIHMQQSIDGNTIGRVHNVLYRHFKSLFLQQICLIKQSEWCRQRAIVKHGRRCNNARLEDVQAKENSRYNNLLYISGGKKRIA